MITTSAYLTSLSHGRSSSFSIVPVRRIQNKMNRNSAKLERVASPYHADTRTRSVLSFDIDMEVDESIGGDERERSAAQTSEHSSPRKALSRLSQKILQRLEGGSTGGSGSESTTVGESTS